MTFDEQVDQVIQALAIKRDCEPELISVADAIEIVCDEAELFTSGAYHL